MKEILFKKIGFLSLILLCNLSGYTQITSAPGKVFYGGDPTENPTSVNKKEDVIKWLTARISPGLPLKSNFIKKILDYGLFNEMRVEQRNMNAVLLVVPMKKVYFSQYIDRTKPLPLQYFILAENNKGQLENGRLMLVYPADKSLKELPKNAFRNFYDQNDMTDGTYSYINIYFGDFLNMEMDINNGERVQMRSYPSEDVVTPTGTCRKWTLTTTDIDLTENHKTQNDLKNIGIAQNTGTDPLNTKRKNAIAELRKQYPLYFNNISDEAIFAGKAAQQFDLLTKSIFAKNSQPKITESIKSLGVSCTACPPGYSCDPISALEAQAPY